MDIQLVLEHTDVAFLPYEVDYIIRSDVSEPVEQNQNLSDSATMLSDNTVASERVVTQRIEQETLETQDVAAGATSLTSVFYMIAILT